MLLVVGGLLAIVGSFPTQIFSFFGFFWILDFYLIIIDRVYRYIESLGQHGFKMQRQMEADKHRWMDAHYYSRMTGAS